jgi:F-type H+-transporting ATPase subunit epsilon
MPIMCEIVSQDRIVYQGEVDIVLIPGVEGELGILPNHSPLLTVVNYGVISTRKGKEEEYFTVAGGIAEVQPNKVTILADAAENVAEIDISRAEEARKRAEHLLHEEIDSIGDDYLKIHSMLRRSMLRINAVKRYRNRLKIRS